MDWVKQCFGDMFINMDWKQFIPSLIATFVGIFVPFFIQARVEKTHKLSEAVQRIEKIIAELSGIADKIIKLNYEQIHLYPIKTPVWDGLLNTNEMLLISNMQNKKKRKKNKNNVEENQEHDWYNMIYKIYGIIDEYNKWWNLYTEKLFLHDKDVVLEPILTQLKKLKMILCFNSFSDRNMRLAALNEINCQEADFKEEESIGYLLKVLNEKFFSKKARLIARIKNKFKSKKNKKKAK